MSLTAEQKANRLRGVGGSEVLAALGKDPRCTRLELYRRKRGESPDVDLEDDERVRFGTLLEPVIRKEFARRTGLRVIQRHRTLYHPRVPLLGHVDGWIPAKRSGVEFKTADRFEADEFGEEETDQVPLRYLVQCHAYIAITDSDEWRLAVLIGGNNYKQYRISRDAEIERAILDGVSNFWDHIVRETPPDPMTPEDVRLRWPKDLGTDVLATEEVEELVAQLAGVKERAKELNEACELQTATVQQFMATNANLLARDGTLLATWRTARPSMRFDTRAFEKAHPALYKQFLRESPGSRRFLLK